MAMDVRPAGQKGAGASSSKSESLKDDTYKSYVVSLTIAILLYPIVFPFVYPLVASVLNLPEEVSSPFGAMPGRDVLFIWLGAVLLALNVLFFLVSFRIHLSDVHKDARAGIERIKGAVAPGGPEEVAKVDDTLTNFERLLSWRYLFLYVGFVTTGFYVFFLLLWGFELGVELKLLANSVFPPWLRSYFEPFTALAILVLAYYLAAFALRLWFRRMLAKYLFANGDAGD